MTPAQDYLESGRYAVYYWVQNNDTAASACVVRVQVQSRAPGKTGNWKTLSAVTRPVRSLGSRERRFDQVPIRIGSRSEYQVTIEVAGPHDQFAKNDRKVFRFVSVSQLPEFRHDRVSR